MAKPVSWKTKTSGLRRKAEARLKTKGRKVSPKVSEDVQKLIHELSVHQVELEMQNEELRRAQTEIEESRSRYTDLFDFAPIPYFVFDRNGTIADANFKAGELLGLDRKALIRKPFRQFIHPDDRDTFHRHRLDTLREPGRQWCDLRLLRKDGSFLNVVLESFLREDKNGNLRHLRSAVWDVTELREKERQISHEHALREAIERSVAIGIAAVDPEGRQSYINPAFCKMVGWSVEELLGKKPPFPYWVPEEMDKTQESFQGVMNGKKPHGSLEFRFRRKNGDRFDALVFYSVLRDGRGKSIGWILSIGDITESKEMAREIRRLNEELEERVRQRTSDLQESESRFRLLSETAGRLLVATDPRQIVNDLCQQVMEQLDCHVCFNFLADEQTGRLRLNACAGLSEEVARKVEHLDYGETVSGCVAREGAPIVAEDLSHIPDPRTELIKSYGIQAYACFPMMAGGRVLGTLSFGTKTQTHFSPSALALVKTVTDQVATAIERVGLIAELQKSQNELEKRVQERTAELAAANEMLQAEMAERMRLVAAVEQAGEGIAITDPEGSIVYANPTFERTVGKRGPELLGKSYYDVLAGEGEELHLKRKLPDIVQGGSAWSGHIQRKGNEGQPYELDITFTPLLDRSGAVSNYVAMERDVTQEIQLQQNLRQMQKMEALGTLAGGIAHDFNNILNPIFLNTEMVLLDCPPGSTAREPLKMVLEAAARGKELVKQIITFSRQREHARKPMKAEPLIKEVLKFLQSSLPRTIEIRENLQKETGFILSDPTQFHQVLMNLCNNAAYAMREEGGELQVGLKEVEVDPDMALRHPDFKPGPYLRLTVGDTGMGMIPEVMERVFDPFFTTKKPGEGSGMGLSVVHGIVKNHGGAVTVESELGKGSVFHVFFPRVEAVEQPPDTNLGPILPGRERILLVDDEETQVQSVQNFLRPLGYAVVAKTDSMEALALFREDPRAFDLVITDQTMPRMTGVKFVEELLRIRPDIPVILCTGFSEKVDSQGAEKIGIRRFLMKPFSILEMTDSIRQALEKK